MSRLPTGDDFVARIKAIAEIDREVAAPDGVRITNPRGVWRLLGITERALRDWRGREQDKGPPWFTYPGSRHIYYDLDQLADWYANKRQRQPP